MKRIVLTIVIAAMTLGAQAQNKIYQKYADMKDVEYVSLGSVLLNLAQGITNISGDEMLSKIDISKLDKMLIITTESKTVVEKYLDKDIATLQKSGYEVVLSSNSDGEKNLMLYNGNISPSEFIIYSREEKDGKVEADLLVIVGKINKQDLQKLISQNM